MDLTTYKELSYKQGDRILVQISREAREKKAAIASPELCFSGRYAVVICSDHPVIGVSKKIKSNISRKRLKKLAEELLPDGYGAIVRTSAAEVREIDFTEEVKALTALAKKINAYGKHAKAPSTVYEKSYPLHATLQALLSGGVSEVVINNPAEQKAITDIIHGLGYNESILILSEVTDLFEHYHITEAFDNAFEKRIWLKSGGYIVIEKTEACIVIDVNTGKSVSSSSRFTTNCEAAVEIAKQLRLRNLSGIVIIDFIGMASDEDRQELHHLLEHETAKDRVRVNVVGMTKLGLMQLTRQRTGIALAR
jgi:ribonuclease G